MHLRNFLTSLSRKFILLISGAILAIAIVFFIWEKNKYRIAKKALAGTVEKKTNGLYSIHYDSLHFDEIAGKAYIGNIHIEPDTTNIKNKKPGDLPYVLLDIRIASIRVNGVRTDRALLGKQLIGDSVVIDHPEAIIYFVKPLQKHTKIETEAGTVYDEILGNLKKIQVGHVFINNMTVKGFGFFTKEKDFDLSNSNTQLTDVLIDSAHSLDTTRTLFCKQAALQVTSFITYNNSRPELRVEEMAFSGKDKSLSFDHISLNRFSSEKSDSSRLLVASGLNLKGLSTNEMVYNKNIIIDTITCKHILLNQPPLENLKSSNIKKSKADTAGFMNVYSIDMKHLNFPKINLSPKVSDGYMVGNISLKINEVKAEQLIAVQTNPMDYSKEVEVRCDKVSMKSKDGFYRYSFNNAAINSMRRQLSIGSVAIKPFLPEEAFANKAHFQKDRYDVDLNEVGLKDIDMKSLLANKIVAASLLINKASVKIYCDLQKPPTGKSKVGNYPSQLLHKINIPINISKAALLNTFIEYREKETLSDSVGDVKFTKSTINVSNITNIPEAKRKNDLLEVSFESRILDTIPIKGTFSFDLDSISNGNFRATGHVSPPFNAKLLNVVSVPMSLVRVNAGNINSVDFNFEGDNLQASGKFVMKYNDFKIDVLKQDKTAGKIKKKGITSLIANVIVTNDNPRGDNLREEKPHVKRNIQKSFFNLVWKTIFTGMKKTVGVP